MSIELTIFVFLALLIIGLPIAFALGLASLTYLFFAGNLPIEIFAQRLVQGSDSFTLMAIPMFMFAGSVLNTGGVTNRLISLARVMVGHLTGALAQINIVVSMLFAGISGSSNADAAGIGKVLIPAMIREGYPPKFAAAVTASSSCVGPIIPPSVVFVVFGGVGMVPIADLFLGGAIPGLIMGIYMMLVTYSVAKRKGYPSYERASFKEFTLALWRGWPALIAPLIIVGGIISGIFTATEAGVVAVFYSFILSVFVYKEMKLKDIWDVIMDTVVSTSMVMFVVGTALAFSWILTRERVPVLLVDWIVNLHASKVVVLLFINLICLFVGMFFCVTANIIMMVPLLLPVAEVLGIHPVHFGVMVVLNFMIGTVTPPVGIPMHMVCNIGGVSIIEFTKTNSIYYFALLMSLVTITLFPELSLWLPSLFGMV